MFIKNLSTILVVALAACTSMGANAQPSDFGFSRAQTLDAEIHGRSRVRPAAGFTIVGPTTVGSLLDPGVLWQDKASMLAAARTGKVFEALVSVTRSNDPQLEPVLTSISVILGTEYGVPPLPTRAYCAETYATDALEMFQMRTLAEGYRLAPGGPTYNPQTTFRGYFDPYVPEQ